MEDKKQDLNPLEELVKTADSYRAFFANLANELSKVLTDIKASDEEENTWEIDYKDKKLKSLWVPNSINGFPTFGYFKNREDAERAIELFGDEIKELFVDCEVQ